MPLIWTPDGSLGLSRMGFMLGAGSTGRPGTGISLVTACGCEPWAEDAGWEGARTTTGRAAVSTGAAVLWAMPPAWRPVTFW